MDMFAMGVTLYVAITGHRPMRTQQANTLGYANFEAHAYPNMQARRAAVANFASLMSIWAA